MMAHYIASGPFKDPMPGAYPSRMDIMQEPGPIFRAGLFPLMYQWKVEFYPGWSHKTDKERFLALTVLCTRICVLYGVPIVGVHHDEWGRDVYYPDRHMMFLSSMSILTTLHELGHHLFGPSEYHACRFSVWLYKNRFPNAFKRLVWNNTPGHEHVLEMQLSSVVEIE